MSLPTSTSVSQEVAAEYHASRTSHSIALAVATLLAYDALLCVGKEARYIWWRPKTSRKVSRILYMYNRYLSLVWNMLDVGFIGRLSDISCAGLIWLGYAMEVLAMLGPAAFTTMRVYALSGRNKIITGVVLLFSMGPFFVNISTLYQDVPVNVPKPEGCVAYVYSTPALFFATVVVSRTCLIIAEVLAVIVTWRRTRGARQTSTQILRRPVLDQTLWENGNVYFCALVSLNIMDITVVALQMFSHPFEFLDYILPFIDPISSILNCRFLLALYETTAQLERGGASASSFSLNLGDANLSGTPDLPEFLTSFAGPIHPTPDDDLEMFDNQRTLPREHDSEADVEVLNPGTWMEAEPEDFGLVGGSEVV